jgi:hypothetical protein
MKGRVRESGFCNCDVQTLYSRLEKAVENLMISIFLSYMIVRRRHVRARSAGGLRVTCGSDEKQRVTAALPVGQGKLQW